MGFVLLKVFPVGIISVYVAYILDFFSNISCQCRCNTTPIGFGGWVQVLIKINCNWMWCFKLSQFYGKLIRPATSKFLNCNDFGLTIIFLQARHSQDVWSSFFSVCPSWIIGIALASPTPSAGTKKTRNIIILSHNMVVVACGWARWWSLRSALCDVI